VDSLLERLRVEYPVLQAGMGGGIDGHALAAAVSEAGGLGTLGTVDPKQLRDELDRARGLTSKPLAVNILLPFARPEHWRAAAEADAVVTFWGEPRRRTIGVWLHQCGSVPEAHAARAAGADGVIAQGVEAGGHVRGKRPGLELLEELRTALPGYPVILSGGIATRSDMSQALEAGAVAAMAGTRFLLSDESMAHAEYKRRLLVGERTLLTTLFGFGWPVLHRVVANAATDRWLHGDGEPPSLVRLTQRVWSPLLKRLSPSAAGRLAAHQRLAMPLFAPSAPLVDSPASMVDVAPLYAGETVARIGQLRPAGELVKDLVP
jgi:nitronate monooxygenase